MCGKITKMSGEWKTHTRFFKGSPGRLFRWLCFELCRQLWVSLDINNYDNDFVLQCSPTLLDYGDNVMREGFGLLTHSMLWELYSHLPREGCAFSMSQFTFAKVKTSTTSQPGSMHRWMLAKQYPREATGFERREEAMETINSHKVWEELHSQNEWRGVGARGGNDSIWRKVAFSLGFQEWRGVSGKEAVSPQTRVRKGSRWLSQENRSWGWHHASWGHYWTVQLWLCKEQ